MNAKEVNKRIRRTERELETAEKKQQKLGNRYTELRCANAPGNILTRYRLELKGATDHINELRLRLWGLKNLNMPA